MSIEDRLVRLIETGGPIPVSTFMQLTLHDPQEGYYAARPGIGRDFITAPETSQVFGELIGVWLVHEWRALGAPAAFHLVEIGPGRGQLMLDALRVAGAIGGEDFIAAMRLVFVEPSPVLAAALGEMFAPSRPICVTRLAEVPEGPALIVANEYLDCLPARQFRKSEGVWRECVVGLTADGQLAFGLAADEPRRRRAARSAEKRWRCRPGSTWWSPICARARTPCGRCSSIMGRTTQRREIRCAPTATAGR